MAPWPMGFTSLHWFSSSWPFAWVPSWVGSAPPPVLSSPSPARSTMRPQRKQAMAPSARGAPQNWQGWVTSSAMKARRCGGDEVGTTT
ncbi:MAG: hypothetical protein JNK82_00330 [Myxococcaceae bacterium]|nr:hypothetical protein [Myxococcaceae bacterium]